MNETQFKQTEIGLVPQEWRVVRLGEIVQNSMYGVAAEAIDFNGVCKYIRITDIDDETHLFNPKPLVSPSFYSDQYMVREGDLLIARTGASVGKSYLYNPKDGELVFAGFLIKQHISNAEPFYVFCQTLTNRYDEFVLSESARTGQPGINVRQIHNFQLPLPPLSEQSRIAGALSSVDGLLSSLSRLIDKKRALRTAAMQQLLNAKTRLPGFNEPWKEVRLGDIMNIKSGDNITASSFVAGGSYPVYGGNGERGCYSLYNLDGRYILIGRVGALCGNIHLTNGKIWASEHCLICYPLSSYSEYFVGAILNRMNLIQYSNASAQPVIAANKLNEIQISLPSLPEQRAIASVLSSMDSELSALEAKRTKVEALRAGMMQQLLTGRIRLTEGDSERK